MTTPPPRRVPRARLLTVAHDCPLCDEALVRLRDLERRGRVEVEVVVIDRDPRLALRHALRVPVIEIDGVEAMHGKIERTALERALDRASGEPAR